LVKADAQNCHFLNVHFEDFISYTSFSIVRV